MNNRNEWRGLLPVEQTEWMATPQKQNANTADQRGEHYWLKKSAAREQCEELSRTMRDYRVVSVQEGRNE